jgi:predicted nucleic acid-binding protein
MNKPTVYIETSIISYLVARPSADVVVRGHQTSTIEWWGNCLAQARPFVSDYVVQEVRRGAPEWAARRLAAIEGFSVIQTSPEAERLAGIYIAERLVPPTKPFDALHLALASASGIEYLLTWNCKHLASAAVRKRAAAINLREGVPVPVICTPEELMSY